MCGACLCYGFFVGMKIFIFAMLWCDDGLLLCVCANIKWEWRAAQKKYRRKKREANTQKLFRAQENIFVCVKIWRERVKEKSCTYWINADTHHTHIRINKLLVHLNKTKKKGYLGIYEFIYIICVCYKICCGVTWILFEDGKKICFVCAARVIRLSSIKYSKCAFSYSYLYIYNMNENHKEDGRDVCIFSWCA